MITVLTNLTTGLLGGGGGASSFNPLDDSDMVAMYSANNANNTTSITTIDFNASDVNTSTDVITMTFPTGEFTLGNPYEAVVGKFTTTGTLPAPFQADVEYLVKDNGDGTGSFYKVVTDADYADIPSYEDGESIDPYQGYACDVKIDITTQGSGTHTFTTYTLAEVIDDHTANTINQEPANSKLNGCVEVLTDGSGGKYFNIKGNLGKANKNEDRYGKYYQDTVDSATLEALIPTKRYGYAVVTQEFDCNDLQHSVQRAFFEPSDVNIATGVITAQNHGLTTGKAVYRYAMSTGGAFPTPTVAFSGPSYVRATTTGTFTLHPTQVDANNNTAPHLYSDAGTGTCCIVDPSEAMVFSSQRQMLLDVCVVDGNSHDLSWVHENYHKVIDVTTSSVWGDGSSGLLFSVFRNSDIGRNFSALPVQVFVPSGSALIDTDTGVSITSGQYWISDENSTNSYLYHTEADALARTNKITYDKASSYGEISFSILGKGILRNFDDGFVLPDAYPLIDIGDYGTFALMVDFEDPSGKAAYTAGYGSINNLLNAVVSTRTYASGLTNGGNVKILLFNTNEPHVAGAGKFRIMIVGFSDTDPTAVMLQHIAYQQATYPTSIS